MSQGNQDRIQQINEEIVKLDKQKSEGVSLETQDRINAQIKALEDERSVLETADQAAEQAEREQSKQAAFVNYVDTLAQMFEALLPSDTFRTLFGINDYEEKRAQFYQLNQAYTGEALDTQHLSYEEIIAVKDERIKALNVQSLADRQQLDEANKTIENMKLDALEEQENHNDIVEELRKQLDGEKEKNRNLQSGIEVVKQENARLTHENETLREQISSLNKQLEEAQKPKMESQPSTKVTDLINQIKTKNDIAPDDFIARWNARQKDDSVKVEVPEVPQQELPFPNENGQDPTSGSANIQLPSAEAPQTAEVATFPTVNPPDVHGPSTGMAVESSSNSGESAETPVSRTEHEALEARVKALEGKVA